MLASINFLLCLLAGFLCIYVMATRRINTMHPLAMLFLTFVGMAFVVWMIDGMVRPWTIGKEALLSRGFVFAAFVCWTAGRIQCENGICQIKYDGCPRHRHQIQKGTCNHHGHMAGGRRA